MKKTTTLAVRAIAFWAILGFPCWTAFAQSNVEKTTTNSRPEVSEDGTKSFRSKSVVDSSVFQPPVPLSSGAVGDVDFGVRLDAKSTSGNFERFDDSNFDRSKNRLRSASLHPRFADSPASPNSATGAPSNSTIDASYSRPQSSNAISDSDLIASPNSILNSAPNATENRPLALKSDVPSSNRFPTPVPEQNSISAARFNDSKPAPAKVAFFRSNSSPSNFDSNGQDATPTPDDNLSEPISSSTVPSENDVPSSSNVPADRSPDFNSSLNVDKLSRDDYSADSLLQNDLPGSQDNLPSIVKQVVYENNTTFYELSNGLVVFVRKDVNSTLATVRAYVRNTGSLYEAGRSGSGISLLVERLVAKSSTRRRSQEETDSVLNRIGGTANSETRESLTTFSVDCSNDHIDEAIDIIADRIQNARFQENQINLEKKIVRQEWLGAENDRRSSSRKNLRETIYPNHPLRYPISGYPELFKQLTLDDVQDFYQTRYVPNNQIIAVFGNVDPLGVVSRIARHYQGKTRGQETVVAFPPDLPQISQRDAVAEMDGETYDAVFAWPTVLKTDPDACVFDLINVVLAQSQNGRLIRLLKNEKSLVLSVDSELFWSDAARGYFAIHFVLSPEKFEQTQKLFFNEIKQLQDLSIIPTEFNQAKKRLEASFVFESESPQISLERTILNYIETGNPDFDQQYIKNVRNITRSDVSRVATKYFQESSLNLVRITPPKMAPQQISNERAIPDEKIEFMRFEPNKLRLIVKPIKKTPIVNIQIFALGGALFDSVDNAGRTALLAETLRLDSAERAKVNSPYDSSEVVDYFDSIGSSFSIKPGRHAIVINATVLKENFETTLPVLQKIIFNSNISNESFQKAKQLQLAKIKSQAGDPVDEIMGLFFDSLPSSTSYHLRLEGTSQSIESVTLDDLKAYHRKLFAPQNVIVSVFGDVDNKATARYVDETFGQIPAVSDFRPASFDRKNEILGPINKHQPTEKEIAMGVWAYPTVSVHEKEDFAALLVLQMILAGRQRSGGLLVDELRDTGQVARISAYQTESPVPGYFYIIFETSPENLEPVLEQIQAIVEQIRQGNLTAQNVEDAKTKLIARYKIENQTAEEKSNRISLGALFGIESQNENFFEEQVAKVTKEQVFAAARKYFNERVLITTSPYQKRAFQ